MSVITSVFSKTFLATMSALVMVAGMLFGANIATADSAWVQSYERSSQTEACVAQPGETQWQVSWGANSSWSPSWEQWANNGNGGWTCTRSITWARTPTAASSGGGPATYAVGDIGPGGGTVFYVDTARAAGSQFWEVGSDLGTAQWGCRGTSISGATGTAIGTGAANTTAITSGSGCATAGIAARVASAPAGGYSDWFLPSKDELNQLCKYARSQSTAVVDQAVPCDATGTLRGGFTSVDNWSSSERYSISAWYQNFASGHMGDSYKDNTTRVVRPIRAF